MFNSKLKKEIEGLKQRLSDLEYPFKFNVGDRVVVTCYDANVQSPFKHESRTVVTHREIIRQPWGGRDNRYLIFDGESSKWLWESWIEAKK